MDIVQHGYEVSSLTILMPMLLHRKELIWGAIYPRITKPLGFCFVALLKHNNDGIIYLAVKTDPSNAE